MATERMDNRGQVKIASGLNIIAGIWLIIASWVLGYSNLSRPLWNDVILGIAVAVIAAIRLWAGRPYAWLSWVNFILGLWLIISPWVLGYSGNRTALWNNVILGIIVAVLSAWSALAAPTRTTA